MPIFPIELENVKVKSQPLTNKSTQSLVIYTKDNFNTKGIGYPTEQFVIVDPSMQSYSADMDEDIFSAVVTVLKNEDGSIYPQIEIKAGYGTFAVWDGTERLGTSDNALYKVDELTTEQLSQFATAKNIMKDALPKIIEHCPNNQTLLDCANYFDCNLEQTKETNNQISIDLPAQNNTSPAYDDDLGFEI